MLKVKVQGKMLIKSHFNLRKGNKGKPSALSTFVRKQNVLKPASQARAVMSVLLIQETL